MKLNNKGFVVSSVLYSILLAFLMFLGATLTMLSSANSLISKANSDLTDGKVLKVIQVKQSYTKLEDDDFAKNDNLPTKLPSKRDYVCGVDFSWYQKYKKDTYGKLIIPLTIINSDIIVKINSSHGTMYWPKDFISKDENGVFSLGNEFKTIKVDIIEHNIQITNVNDYNKFLEFVQGVKKLKIIDGTKSKELIIGNICG